MQDLLIVQIQPRKHGLDHADYTAPTRQHVPDDTDHTDRTDHTDPIDHALDHLDPS